MTLDDEDDTEGVSGDTDVPLDESSVEDVLSDVTLDDTNTGNDTDATLEHTQSNEASNTDSKPSHGGSVLLAAIGILLTGGSATAIVYGIEHTALPAALAVGILALALGIAQGIRVRNEQSRRRHEELVETIDSGHEDILRELDDIDSGFESALGPRARTLLKELRTQRDLVKELKGSLGEQSGTMTALADELEDRNEALETVFEELFGDDSDGGSSADDVSSDDDDIDGEEDDTDAESDR